jgi:uncharacterized phiE125 gp8 family phage protein
MTLIRTAEPAVEPVTLTGMKEHLRVTHDSEDALISDLIKAAREEVERSTSLALVTQGWRLALDGWPRSGLLQLRPNPVSSISSVTVYDEDGEGFVLVPDAYQLDSLTMGARLKFNEMPSTGQRLNGIEVDFVAGYGNSAEHVPEALKRAMAILVSHWFEFRGAYGAKDQPVSIPDEYLRIIAGYRMPRL